MFPVLLRLSERAASGNFGGELMETTQAQTRRKRRLPIALETELDEAVEFHIPETPPPHYFFALDEGEGAADLVVVMEDLISGETEHRIDFDEAVESLLQTFREEPPVTLREKYDDVATLRQLARRFQAVASRLLYEARKRQDEFQLPRRLAG
jgi:hypothetical protein